MRPVLDLLQSSLDHPHQLLQARHREIGQPTTIQQRPDSLRRVEIGRIRRQLNDPQPVSAPGDELPHLRAGVPVEVVPDQHDDFGTNPYTKISSPTRRDTALVVGSRYCPQRLSNGFTSAQRFLNPLTACDLAFKAFGSPVSESSKNRSLSRPSIFGGSQPR